jgi:sortase A
MAVLTHLQEYWRAYLLNAIFVCLLLTTHTLAYADETLASGEFRVLGGGRGNGAIMLAGHRDSHFAFVSKLSAGDRIRWQEAGRSAKEFRVSATHVIDIRLQEEIVPPENTLLLVTCYPFDALSAGGPLRYVVVAEEVVRL